MRTKNLLSISVLLALQLFFLGCEKVDDPYPVNDGQSIPYQGTEYIIDTEFEIGNTTQLITFIDNNNWESLTSPNNSNQRFILLEEFTGQKCTFCPDGTREIIRLDTIFKEVLIPVAIHAGTFAEPQDPSSGKYTTDFRVDGGHSEDYLNQFNPGKAFPRGTVSRFDNGSVSGPAAWEGQINSLKSESPIASLTINNHYSPNQNAVRVQIDLEWLTNTTEEYNLQVYLAEDHIIDWQLDNGVAVPNYDHRHVLRKVVNGTWGKSIGQAIQGETISIQYITRVDADWKANDMESIAFIYKNDGYEVMQANAAYIYKP